MHDTHDRYMCVIASLYVDRNELVVKEKKPKRKVTANETERKRMLSQNSFIKRFAQVVR